MSIIHPADPPAHPDEFAINAVITILRRESRTYEDNLRRNPTLASRELMQRVVNQVHSTINGLEASLAEATRTEAAA